MIGADGITLDLHGHALRGTNAAGSLSIVVDGHPGVPDCVGVSCA